ncbi:MAG: hypothetical protein HY909_13210 [Deltaproteobacteria bacterium]|nr:hypothetical protein [Deltaproteobacteria bacterium]
MWWCALGLLGWPSPLLAQGLNLRWEAPEECPREGLVRAAAEALQTGPGRPVEAQVQVERQAPRRWHLRLRTVTAEGEGQRTLWVRSCREAAEATAVVLAFLLDGGVVSEAPRRAPPGDARVLPVYRLAFPTWDPEVPEPPPRPARAPPRWWWLFARTALDVGSLPGPSVGLGLGGAWERGRFRVELQGWWWAPQTQRLRDGAGGAFQRGTGQLRGCWLPLLGALQAGTCVGLELGWLHGRGVGVGRPEEGTAFWGAASLGLLFRARLLGRWHLLGLLEEAWVFHGGDFQLRDAEPVFASGRGALRVVLGLELRFP